MKLRILFVTLVMVFFSAIAAFAQGDLGIRLGFEGFTEGDMGSNVDLDRGILGGDFEVFGGLRSLGGVSVELNAGVRYHRPEWLIPGSDLAGEDQWASTNLFIVPFYVQARWRILQSVDPNAWVTPYIGGGAGGYYAVFGKWENVENHDGFDRTEFIKGADQVAPGFHGMAGVEFLANQRVSVQAEFRYTYLKLTDLQFEQDVGPIPSRRHIDLDLSAWQILFAVCFNLGELPGDSGR